MENMIKIFESEEFGRVRTVIKNGEPWFVGKDVAVILGYSDVNKAVAMHVDNEDKKLNDKTSSSFGQRGTTLINESGLYSLILSTINEHGLSYCTIKGSFSVQNPLK